MFSGILSGIAWAIETIAIGIALSMGPCTNSQQALLLAPFACTLLHDVFSAVWAFFYTAIRKNLWNIVRAFKTKSFKYMVLAAVIGGPLGQTGYVLAVANLGASIGAVASAIFPAIGAVLAYFILKEKMSWYRWLFLLFSLLGVYGLSYSPEVNVTNFWLGVAGAMMCAFGWGTEAVIVAKSVQDPAITDEIVTMVRPIISTLVYGVVVLPVVKGWGFTVSLLWNSGRLLPTISLAGLFATISHLLYYNAISRIGPSKSMALNITYSAWAVVFGVLFLKDNSLLNPVTILCTITVLVFGILAGADYKDIIKKNK